jgi:hypothetical protein
MYLFDNLNKRLTGAFINGLWKRMKVFISHKENSQLFHFPKLRGNFPSFSRKLSRFYLIQKFREFSNSKISNRKFYFSWTSIKKLSRKLNFVRKINNNKKRLLYFFIFLIKTKQKSFSIFVQQLTQLNQNLRGRKFSGFWHFFDRNIWGKVLFGRLFD